MSKPTIPKFGGYKAPPDGGRYARALGSFLMNCGVLEYHSYSWLMVFSPTFDLPNDVAELGWSDRIGRIERDLKSRKVSKALRAEIAQAWKEVRKFAELRNIVAHGPMFWGDNEDGTLMGIVPNMKRALRKKPPMIIQYDDISESVPATGLLLLRLEGLLNRLAEDMGIQVPTCDEDTQT